MTTLSACAFRALLLLSIVSLVAMGGCGSLRKKGGDEGDAAAQAAVAEAVDAAPPPALAPIAANVDEVARFPDEKPLENVAATLQRTTNVREIPSVGKVVATLAKGAAVTEVAQRGTAFLVLVDHPKDQKKVMGWVGQESFTAAPAVAAGIKAPSCTPPEVPLMSEGPFCGRICTSNAECPGGQACRGVASKLTKGKAGDAVTLCTVFTPIVRPAEPVTANAGRAPVTPVVPAPPPAPLGGGRTAPVAGEPAPAPAPTSGLPPCPENPAPRTRRPGDGDGRPPPPTDCIQLPSQNRLSGMQCAGRNQCKSHLCSAGACRTCGPGVPCDFDTACTQGVCFSTRDPEPESPRSGGGSPASRPEPKPKGSERGRMCSKGSDCQSGSCKMENRTRGRCQ